MNKNNLPFYLSMNELRDNYKSDLDNFLKENEFETEADFIFRLKNLFLTQLKLSEDGELHFAFTMNEFDHRIKSYKYASIDVILYAINNEVEGYNLTLLSGYISVPEPFPLFRYWQVGFNDQDEEYKCEKLPYLEREEIRDLFFFNDVDYEYKKEFYELLKISYPQILFFFDSRLHKINSLANSQSEISEQSLIERASPVVEAPIPHQIKTKAQILKDFLSQYGFFELEKVELLSEPAKVALVTLLNENGCPYQIAMFDYLGYLKYLKIHYCKSKVKLIKVIATITDSQERTVKGNINVLDHYSKESRRRYTADKHKENVIKDYEKLN